MEYTSTHLSSTEIYTDTNKVILCLIKNGFTCYSHFFPVVVVKKVNHHFLSANDVPSHITCYKGQWTCEKNIQL